MDSKKQNILFIVIIVILSFCMLFIMGKRNREGDKVLVYVDGRLVQELFLDEDKEIVIRGKIGNNVLVIQGQEVYMKEASCENHICVQQGKISKGGQTIVCLPNQIVVEVSSQINEMDVVVR